MGSFRALLLLLLLAAIQIQAAYYTDSQSAEFEEWQEFKEFQKWKHARKHHGRGRPRYPNNDLQRYRDEEWGTSNEDRNADDPPPIDEAARMARYIVNQNTSYSDGPLSNGTGMPYLYITPLDYTAQDLAKDARATLSMTLASAGYCAEKSYDPMDPRCARVYITGIIKAVKNNTAEFEVAKNAVFGRHPWLAHMPPNHHFFFVKVRIIQIALLDTFGGPKYITPKDYFAANQLPALPRSYLRDDLTNLNFDYELEDSSNPEVSVV